MSKCQNEGIEGETPLFPSNANDFLPLSPLHFMGWLASHNLPKAWAPCGREPCDINFLLKCANSFFCFLLFSETDVIIADFSHLNPGLSFGKRPRLPFFSFFLSSQLYTFSVKSYHLCAFRGYLYSFCFPIFIGLIPNCYQWVRAELF